MNNKVFVILFALVASVCVMAQSSFYPTSGYNANGASRSSQSPVFGSMSAPIQFSTSAAQSLNENLISVDNEWIPAEPQPLSDVYATTRRESGPRRGNHDGEDYPGTPGEYDPQPIGDISWTMALLVLGYGLFIYSRTQRCKQNED